MAMKEFLKLNIKKKTVETGTKAFVIDDHGKVVIFIPSYGVTAYGDTLDEAKYMLSEIVFEDYFKELLKLNESQIFEELRKSGWERNEIFHKKYNRTASYVDPLGVLKDFDLPADTPIKEEYIVA